MKTVDSGTVVIEVVIDVNCYGGYQVHRVSKTKYYLTMRKPQTAKISWKKMKIK